MHVTAARAGHLRRQHENDATWSCFKAVQEFVELKVSLVRMTFVTRALPTVDGRLVNSDVDPSTHRALFMMKAGPMNKSRGA